MRKRKKVVLYLVFPVFLFFSSCMAGLAAKMVMLDSDTDKDSSLSFNEFWDLQKDDLEMKEKAKSIGMSHEKLAKQNFEKFDVDDNNLLSAAEFKKYIKYEMKEAKKN